VAKVRTFTAADFAERARRALAALDEGETPVRPSWLYQAVTEARANPAYRKTLERQAAAHDRRPTP